MASPWDNILKDVSAIPVIGTPAAIARGIGESIQGKNPTSAFMAGIPGVGSAFGLMDALGGSGVNSGASTAPQSSGDSQTMSYWENIIPKLTYGQEQGSSAAAVAKELSGVLQGLPAADAEKILKMIPAGSTLATDIQKDVTPQPTPTTGSYGFDPLSLGKIFSQTLAPWLSQQEKITTGETNSLAQQMQGQLSKASPGMQQAYGLAIPELQASNAQLTGAANSALATAPEWDAFISNLANATNAAKLAQAAAQAEPYWAATTGGSAVPTSGGYGTAQNALSAIQQQILGQTAATH